MIIDKIVSENKIVLPHNKEYSLQFLPEKLLTISEVKNLTFNGEKLKSSYIIDIVHNLLLKYYLQDQIIL